MVSYSKSAIVCKFLQIIGATLLILAGVFKFINNTALINPVQFILTIYFFLFALIIILVELNIGFATRRFTFMTYFFGKGVFSLFVGTIIFTDFFSLQFAASMFFLATSVIYLLLSCCYNSHEKEKIQEIKERELNEDLEKQMKNVPPRV